MTSHFSPPSPRAAHTSRYGLWQAHRGKLLGSSLLLLGWLAGLWSPQAVIQWRDASPAPVAKVGASSSAAVRNETWLAHSLRAVGISLQALAKITGEAQAALGAGPTVTPPQDSHQAEAAVMEAIRQRIERGEVDEKGLLDLYAPEVIGGWRPAPPSVPRPAP